MPGSAGRLTWVLDWQLYNSEKKRSFILNGKVQIPLVVTFDLCCPFWDPHLLDVLKTLPISILRGWVKETNQMIIVVWLCQWIFLQTMTGLPLFVWEVCNFKEQFCYWVYHVDQVNYLEMVYVEKSFTQTMLSQIM